MQDVDEAIVQIVRKRHLFLAATYIVAQWNSIHQTSIMETTMLHEKNDFEISKNLVRYRSENNFVGPSK